MAKTAWRCSQCGTVNEAGARACSACGKWPSLFDLQDDVADEVEPAPPDVLRGEVFETETFETDTFEPEVPDETDDTDETDETNGRRSRFPRWAITAVWVIGILVWFVVNALADRS